MSARGKAERPRLGAVGARREDLERAAVPGGGIDDRLAVRGEARGENRAAPERERAGTSDRGVGPAPDHVAREVPERPTREATSGSPARASGAAGPSRARRPRSLRRRKSPRGDRARSADRARDPSSRRSAPRGPWRGSARRSSARAPAPSGLQLRDRLGLVADDRRQRLGAGLPLEGALARRHLVEDRAERELVRAEVDRLARSPARATCSRPCP